MVGNLPFMIPAKMCKFEAVVLDTELDSALRLFASTKLAHFIDIQDRADELKIAFKPVEASEHYYYLSNLATRVTSLITELKINRGGSPKTPLAIPSTPDDAYFSKLETQLKQIEDNKNDLAQKLEQTEASGEKSEKKAAKKALEAFAKEYKDQLLGWEEVIQREHLLEETKTLFGKTHRTYIMAGWVPSKKTRKFAQLIEAQSNEHIALTIHPYQAPPHAHGKEAAEVAEEYAEQEPPTQQSNPKSLGAFQTLVNAFGIPNIREIDPTWFLAIGFPIVFGMMFGDIGHGLLLAFFAFIGMMARRRKVDAGEMVNYFLQGSGLIFVIGLVSVFFGVLYGEFLGIDISGLQIGGVYVYQQLKYSPFGQAMAGFLANLFRIFDFDGGVNWFLNPHSPYNSWILGDPHAHPTPIWFSAFEMPEHLPANVASPTWILFVFSIMIGFIHLSIAIAFDAINKLRHKEFKHAIFGPIIWLWFLWGLATMLFTKGINFMDWFTFWDIHLPCGGNVFCSPLLDFAILIIIPLVIMFVGGIIAFGFMEGFMEGIEKVIESISNTISYARILALNMAHAGFAKTFLFLGGVAVTESMWILANIINPALTGAAIMPFIMFLLMLMIGTIFVLFMEGLLSFIHALRLHWVEAFLKFFAGTGHTYTPLTLPARWTAPPAK
jgi:V/A-type H+-transporting ATPase subunit I